MTISERSQLRLRLMKTDYPDGEIPLDRLSAVARGAQLLVTRLARAGEGRGGVGRSPRKLSEDIRLMFVGIEPGSTQLLIAAPPREPQLDLGPAFEQMVEQALAALADGVDAAANGEALPEAFDDLSRRALGEWLDAIAQASGETEMESRIGGRPPKTVRFRPSQAVASVQGATADRQSLPPVEVEGVLYAVNLHTGRYVIEDDMGSSINLLTSMFTGEQVAPLLGRRVKAGGNPEYDDGGRLKEIDVLSLTPAPSLEGFDSDRFRRGVELEELLEGVEPIQSVDDLAIDDLTEAEIDAFVRSLAE